MSIVSTQVVARLGRPLDELAADRIALGVDLDADRAVAAAQDLVVLQLDAVAPDPVARLELGVDRLVELFSGDLADVAEQVGASRPFRVVADVDLLGA